MSRNARAVLRNNVFPVPDVALRSDVIVPGDAKQPSGVVRQPQGIRRAGAVQQIASRTLQYEQAKTSDHP